MLTSIHLLPELLHIDSPWDNQFGINVGESWTGPGPDRLVVAPYPVVKDRPDDAGLGLGHWEDSTWCGRFEGFALNVGDQAKQRPTHGILVRGRAELRHLRIVGVRGDTAPAGKSKEGLREAFGIHVSNRNPSGQRHGGTIIDDVEILVGEPDSYVTGVCIGTQEHPGQVLSPTLVRDVRVVAKPRAHAAFTATLDTRFERVWSTGTAYGFYCDTGRMEGVLVTDYQARVWRAAVALVAGPDKTDKRRLLVRDAVFDFEGPGPHYALEIMNTVGAQIGDIEFRNCVFRSDDPQFLALSTDAQDLGSVQFNGCTFPSGTRLHAPRLGAASLARSRVNGATIQHVFRPYGVI